VRQERRFNAHKVCEKSATSWFFSQLDEGSPSNSALLSDAFARYAAHAVRHNADVRRLPET
jgi:hypothetical protein